MTEQATPPASRFQARAIATLWRTLSRWPVRWLWRIAALVGPQVYRFSKRERKVTEINLKVVYPDAPANQRQSLAKQSTALMRDAGTRSRLDGPAREGRSQHSSGTWPRQAG